MLSRTGTLARVQWNDNGAVEENVRLGGENLLAVAGTRRHQFPMDLPALIERFTSDPVAVVVELLRESSKGLKAQAIKELLIELGLEPAAVDRAWRGVQAKLAKRDDVRFRANTYRWVWPRPAEDVIESPDPSAEAETTAPPVEEAGSRSDEYPGPRAPQAEAEAMDTPVPEAPQAEAETTAPRVPEISPRFLRFLRSSRCGPGDSCGSSARSRREGDRAGDARADPEVLVQAAEGRGGRGPEVLLAGGRCGRGGRRAGAGARRAL